MEEGAAEEPVFIGLFVFVRGVFPSVSGELADASLSPQALRQSPSATVKRREQIFLVQRKWQDFFLKYLILHFIREFLLFKIL